MSPKSTPFEAFEEIHQVVLDSISDNMVSLVQSGNYVAIDTDDITTNRFLCYYVHLRGIHTAK